MHELGPVYRQSDTSKVNSWQEIHTVKSREKDWSVKHHSRHPQFTCPPVSGKPNTLAWPKYPWGDTTTTSKIMGILPKNFSSVDGSGAWRISRSRWIISNTCSDVSPQPFSRPHSWNLNVTKRKQNHIHVLQPTILLECDILETLDLYIKEILLIIPEKIHMQCQINDLSKWPAYDAYTIYMNLSCWKYCSPTMFYRSALRNLKHIANWKLNSSHLVRAGFIEKLKPPAE